MKGPAGQLLDKGKQFMRKYFMEGWATRTFSFSSVAPGQKLEPGQVAALAALPEDASLMQRIMVKHRRLIGDPFSLFYFSRNPHSTHLL